VALRRRQWVHKFSNNALILQTACFYPQSRYHGIMMHHPIQFTVWIAAAAIVAIWPMAFSVIKIGLEYFSPLGLMTLRMLTGVVVMVLYVLVRRYPLPRGRDLALIAVSGLCGVGLYSYFINVACETITAGETAFLIATNPMFVALAGWRFFGETIGLKTLTGMAVAFCGVGVITLQASHGLTLEVGTLFAIASGLVFAVYLLLQKSLLGRYPLDMIGAYSCIFGGGFFMVFLPVAWDEFSLALPFKAHATYLFLGIISTAAGFLVWSYVLKNLSRMRAASIVYLLPFSATINAMWLIDEHMELSAWLGGGLIIVGVAIVNIRRATKLAAKGEEETESLMVRE